MPLMMHVYANYCYYILIFYFLIIVTHLLIGIGSSWLQRKQNKPLLLMHIQLTRKDENKEIVSWMKK